MRNNLITLSDIKNNPSLPDNIGGGKFYGLVQIAALTEEWAQKYGLNIEIPKTYVIPTNSVSQKDIENKTIPEEILNTAMYALAACGGNVAVRSSANIEDKGGKTYSGAFKSVLSVKNKTQMYNALNKVYSSLYNKQVLADMPKEELAMGIIIQPMIQKPLAAGVIYSETFNSDPFIVFNYVQGKTADKLVTKGDSGGELLAVGKAAIDKETGEPTLLNLENLRSPKHDLFYMPLHSKSPQKVTPEIFEQNRLFFELSALINSIEEKLGHPIDMEFAISQNGKINILQQRPYIKPQFISKKLSPVSMSHFNPQRPVIEGNVSILNPETNKQKLNDIIIKREQGITSVYTKKSFELISWGPHRESTPFYTNLYNHYGNMERESLDYSVFVGISNDKLNRIKDGDYFKMNLENGEFISHAKQSKKRNIADIIQTVKNHKSK